VHEKCRPVAGRRCAKVERGPIPANFLTFEPIFSAFHGAQPDLGLLKIQAHNLSPEKQTKLACLSKFKPQTRSAAYISCSVATALSLESPSLPAARGREAEREQASMELSEPSGSSYGHLAGTRPASPPSQPSPHHAS
jgi:hypothetical protein